MLLEHLCSEYPTIIPFFPLLSFSLPFVPGSLNVIRSRHIRIPIALSSGPVLRLPRSTPSLVDRRRVAITKATNSPIRYILQLSRRSTSIAQTSASARLLPVTPASRFRPSSALCWASLSSLSLYVILSFYPAVFRSFRNARRRIITREPEFHFALIERSVTRCASRIANANVFRR